MTPSTALEPARHDRRPRDRRGQRTTRPTGGGKPSEREALWFWLKLGCISFGGPAGQIAIMHDELVERRRWISERRFLHALNFCMALPGPEAQQLASYIGYSLYGVRGAITSGGLFVAPSFVLLCLMSGIYVEYGDVTVVQGVVSGLGAAVVALVAAAVLRVGSRVIHTRSRDRPRRGCLRGDRRRRPVPDHPRRRRRDRLPGRSRQPALLGPAGRPRRRRGRR